MNPYRYVLTKTIQPSLFERLLRRLTRFQFARRRLGGHWERHWEYSMQYLTIRGTTIKVPYPVDGHGVRGSRSTSALSLGSLIPQGSRWMKNAKTTEQSDEPQNQKIASSSS